MFASIPGSQLLTIYSKTTTIVDGVASDSTSQTETFWGLVFPLSNKELKALPEGRRHSETIKIISTYAFTVPEDGSSGNGQVVVYDGKNYEILPIRKLSFFSYGHNVAIAARIA